MLPSIDEVKKIAASGDYRRIPVRREIMADTLTPIQAISKLRAASHHCFLLESAEADERWGRYTFLGFNPTLEVTSKNGFMRIRSGAKDVDGTSKVVEKVVDHPKDTLRKILADHRSAVVDGMPPFTGGLVGYFAYDYLKYAEPVLRTEEDEDQDFLDVDLMLFDKVIAFDSYRQKICIIGGVEVNDDGAVKGTADSGVEVNASGSVAVNDDGAVKGNVDSGVEVNADGNIDTSKIEASYAQVNEELEEIEQLLLNGPLAKIEPLELLEPLAPVMPREEYCSIVERGKEYIREGDIFQVVLSDPQRAKVKGSLFDAYRLLRGENPSPYMFYFVSDDVEIVGSSPETLVRLEEDELFTYPLAGSRPRGATPEEDKQNEIDLLADDKELAEHNMLVDLGRNDLGRVSEIGTVHVEKYQEVLRFSKIMHIGSTVHSQIASDKDALDAIDSILPAGTLSGAPKIRACQIIRELEGGGRGIYGGAIGYLDFTGGMDVCIAIRLAYKKNDTVCVQSGAGIVADSQPNTEFDECMNKARAVVQAIEESVGGIS